MNSIGVIELTWETIEKETNRIISIGNKSILLFPEPEVAMELKAEVDVVVSSSSFEPSIDDKTILLDYFYRSSEKLRFLEGNSNYYNFRNGKAFFMLF